MNPEQYSLVRELFHELVDLPAARRIRLLRERDLDDEIVAEVAALLDQKTPPRALQEGERLALVRSLIKTLDPAPRNPRDDRDSVPRTSTEGSRPENTPR